MMKIKKSAPAGGVDRLRGFRHIATGDVDGVGRVSHVVWAWDVAGAVERFVRAHPVAVNVTARKESGA